MNKFIALLVCALPAVLGVSQSAAETHSLSIRQHSAIPSPLDDTQAENVLSKINNMLSGSCNVKFKLHDSVALNDSVDAPFSINSQSDLNFYKTRPGSIDVVGEINWCGGIGPNIRGCANTPGRSLVVVRMSEIFEHILWAHEFMHTTGSRHRDSVGAIMRPVLKAEDILLNEEECELLKAGSPAVETDVEAADFEDGPPMSADDGLSQVATEGTPESVMEFIQNEFPHGTPYALASLYGDGDVGALREVLLDPNKESLWSNTVATLGAIGSERSITVLMDFLLSSADENLSTEGYLARSNVPIALGWAARRAIESNSSDKSTIQLLLKMTNGDWWTEEAKVAWKTPIHKSQDDLVESLVIKSFAGLSLTGSPEGEARMKEALSGSIDGAPEAAFTQEETVALQNLDSGVRDQLQSVSPMTREAILSSGGESFLNALSAESARVREFGLNAYYK